MTSLDPSDIAACRITAFTGDARPNIQFYCGVLGLRLLDLSVDRDDPRICHIAFGLNPSERAAPEAPAFQSPLTAQASSSTRSKQFTSAPA